jgi:hypothetical protein
MVTDQTIQEFIELLAEEIDTVNDAAADDDRGRGDHGLILIIFEDGSGRIGQQAAFGPTQEWESFNSAAELVSIFRNLGHDIGQVGPHGTLPPFDDDVRRILGRPNFACVHLASALRRAGQHIDRKAEAEQAAVIYWMLGFYCRFGQAWVEEADKELKKILSSPDDASSAAVGDSSPPKGS